MTFPTPSDEAGRLAALRSYAILDSAPEPAFDRLTRLAATLFDVPIALVSFVDQDRQWFKSCHGIELDGTDRDVAFCAYAILADEVMVVPDTLEDARFAESPFVTNLGIRFYAGAPLVTPDGQRLGTLCIKDRRPRDLNHDERELLADLAAIVMDEMRLRLALARVAAGAAADGER